MYSHEPSSIVADASKLQAPQVPPALLNAPVLSIQPGIGVDVIVVETGVPKCGPAPVLPPGRFSPAVSVLPSLVVQIVLTYIL